MKKICICLIFIVLNPFFAAAESTPDVYTTWENMEIDKCASAWLIKRFVNKNAAFRLFPKGELMTEGIPFDVPHAEIRRYHNMATFEYLIKKHKISDPALRKIGDIIHDIEINYWGKKKQKESRKTDEAIREIIKISETPEESLRRSFAIFDSLYSRLLSDCQQE